MKKIAIFILVSTLLFFGTTAALFFSRMDYWREQAIHYKKVAKKQSDSIKKQADQIKSLAALDRRYSEKIRNAHAEIENLKADVASGHKRLQLRANCPSLPATSDPRTSGLDDAAYPRLDGTAEQNYYLLVNRIRTAMIQTEALQEYIHQHCMKEFGGG